MLEASCLLDSRGRHSWIYCFIGTSRSVGLVYSLASTLCKTLSLSWNVGVSTHFGPPLQHLLSILLPTLIFLSELPLENHVDQQHDRLFGACRLLPFTHGDGDTAIS
jgi:hypothetical protein